MSHKNTNKNDTVASARLERTRSISENVVWPNPWLHRCNTEDFVCCDDDCAWTGAFAVQLKGCPAINTLSCAVGSSRYGSGTNCAECEVFFRCIFEILSVRCAGFQGKERAAGEAYRKSERGMKVLVGIRNVEKRFLCRYNREGTER